MGYQRNLFFLNNIKGRHFMRSIIDLNRARSVYELLSGNIVIKSYQTHDIAIEKKSDDNILLRYRELNNINSTYDIKPTELVAMNRLMDYHSCCKAHFIQFCAFNPFQKNDNMTITKNGFFLFYNTINKNKEYSDKVELVNLQKTNNNNNVHVQ